MIHGGRFDDCINEMDMFDTLIPRPEPNSIESRLRKERLRGKLFQRKVDVVRLGRFILLERIGAGGMGEIYSAYDERLDRKVAIKLLLPEHEISRRSKERLLREAHVLASLQHHNIVQIYDADEVEGRVFIAMEYIRGMTLGEWVRTRDHHGRKRIADILAMYIDVGRGLYAAHRQGIVHRDFKPSNVLIDQDGQPRVLDFGLARAMCTDLYSARVGQGRTGEPGQPGQQIPGPILEDADTVDMTPQGAEAQTRASSSAQPGDHDTAIQMRGDQDAAITRIRSFTGAMSSQRAAMVLTTHGKLMGTPSYMAPEQQSGDPVDARCDQYSFCVSLYDALYGHKPPRAMGLDAHSARGSNPDGSGKSAADDSDDTRSSVAPAETVCDTANSTSRRASSVAWHYEVPSPVRKVLERGLAADPRDRFANMGELLAALESWPRRRRRQHRLGILMAVGFTAGLLGYLLKMPPPPCENTSAAITEVWNPTRKSTVVTALKDSGVANADAIAAYVGERVDRYVQDWTHARQANCEATHVEHSQSADMLSRRNACLDRGKRELDVAVRYIESAAQNRNGAVRAGDLLDRLPPLSMCSDSNIIMYGIAAPADNIAADVATIEQYLTEHRYGYERSGDHGDWLRQARAYAEDAQKLGYGPLQAEVQYHIGKLLVAHGRGSADAAKGEDILIAAAHTAVSSRHDELAAQIWIELALASYQNHENTERGREYMAHALDMSARLGDPLEYQTMAARALGLLARKDGNYAEAEDHLRRMVGMLDEKEMPYRFARALHELGTALRVNGKVAEARNSYERALAVLQQIVGPQHFFVADITYDLATLHSRNGQPEKALERMNAVLMAYRVNYGETHRFVGQVLYEIADIYRDLGQLDMALQYAERSRDMFVEVFEPGHFRHAEVATRIGYIAYRQRNFAEAVAAYERALAILQQKKGAGHIDVGYALVSLGQAYIPLERYDDAMRALDGAAAIFATWNDDPVLTPFLAHQRGAVWLARGQVDKAIALLEESVAGFASLSGYTMEVADARWTLARALTAAGQPGQRAESLARAALAVYRDQGESAEFQQQAVQDWLRKHSR